MALEQPDKRRDTRIDVQPQGSLASLVGGGRFVGLLLVMVCSGCSLVTRSCVESTPPDSGATHDRRILATARASGIPLFPFEEAEFTFPSSRDLAAGMESLPLERIAVGLRSVQEARDRLYLLDDALRSIAVSRVREIRLDQVSGSDFAWYSSILVSLVSGTGRGREIGATRLRQIVEGPQHPPSNWEDPNALLTWRRHKVLGAYLLKSLEAAGDENSDRRETVDFAQILEEAIRSIAFRLREDRDAMVSDARARFLPRDIAEFLLPVFHAMRTSPALLEAHISLARKRIGESAESGLLDQLLRYLTARSQRIPPMRETYIPLPREDYFSAYVTEEGIRQIGLVLSVENGERSRNVHHSGSVSEMGVQHTE